MTGWIWAARDVLRRPGEAALTALALAGLVAVLGTALLLTGAVEAASTQLVSAGPAVVVRRVSAGGWAPLPEGEAVRAASEVRGALDVHARVWGTATGPAGPVTVLGSSPAVQSSLAIDAPGADEAVVGPGVASPGAATVVLTAVDGGSRTLDVVRTLSPRAMAHDLVVVHPDVARALLGLEAGQASDLVLDVHHPAEEEAILADLARAMPWPVRLETRSEALGAARSQVTRRGGLVSLAMIPALLALALLVVGAGRSRDAQRREVGTLKALGWTTSDVVALIRRRAVVVAVPAVILGAAAAWALALWPGTTWAAAWLLGWGARPAGLYLPTEGALLTMAEVVALVLVPWWLAVQWPAWRAALTDPADLLDEEAP